LETRSHYVVQTDLEFTMKTRLASNSWSSCLSLFSAQIYRHASPWPASNPFFINSYC
jgi:hypothetical protein